MLVTLDQAKNHCRVDGNDDDAILSLYIGAAELCAAEYLNRNIYASVEDMAVAVLDGTSGDNPIVVNDLIKAAILLTAGHLYANREDVLTGISVATLPIGSHSLLQPYRIGMGI